MVLKMDTNAMVNAITRFLARRPGTTSFISDCGTNLKGADADLKKELANLQSGSQAELVKKGIAWKFIPPGSPTYGGVWERVVGLFKRHLKILQKGDVLNVDVFNTIIVEIEAIVNRRPITAISADSRDCEALTPAHILYPATFSHSSTPITSSFEPVEAETLRNSWKRAQSRVNAFWKTWSRDYLTLLHERKKWERTARDLKVGDLVLVAKEQVSRSEWKLGRVVDVDGDDTHIRKATVKRADGKIVLKDRMNLVLLELDG
jgi:hypothetical protein